MRAHAQSKITPKAQTETKSKTLSFTQQQALGLLQRMVTDLKSDPDKLSAAPLLARAADLLWLSDEQEARATFRLAFETARQAVEAAAPVTDQGDARKSSDIRRQATVLREVLRRFGSHDSRTADAWLKEFEVERTTTTDKRSPASLSAQRAELLAQLALGLSAEDPQKSQQLGLLSLAGGTLPDSFGRLLFALANQDRSLSDGLFREAVNAMRRGDYAYTSALFSLANYAFDEQGKSLPELARAEAQLLTQYLLDATSAQVTLWRASRQAGGQALPEAGARFYGFLVTRGASIIDLNAPDKQALLRSQLNELRAGLDRQQAQQTEQLLSDTKHRAQLTGGDGSDVESRLKQADEENDPATRDLLLRQAALSLLHSDTARALSVAAKIKDSAWRAQTEDDIQLRLFSTKLREQDYDEARRAAIKLNDSTLRAKMLASLAGAVLTRTKDLARATELLDEAHAITLKEDNTPGKLEALLIIAGQFAKYDALKGWDTLADAVATLNQLDHTKASALSNAESSPMMRVVTITAINGEEISTGDHASLDTINFNRLTPLVKQDFTQAVAVAGKINNKLMRARFMLAVVESVLSSPVHAAVGANISPRRLNNP